MNEILLAPKAGNNIQSRTLILLGRSTSLCSSTHYGGGAATLTIQLTPNLSTSIP